MKKKIAFIVFGLIFFLGCEAKKEIKDSYTVAIDSGGEAPTNYRDKKTGEILGIGVDLIREIAKRGDFKIAFIEETFAAMLSGVQDGEVDMGIGFISIIDERKKVLKFSKPYMETDVVVLANKKNETANTGEQIYGISKGTYFRKLLENKGNIEIIEQIDTNKVVEKLVLKEIDYGITSKELAQTYIVKHPEIYEKMVLHKDLIGIAFNKNTPDEFVDKVNKILLEMKSDGSLDNIKKKYGIYKEN